MAIIKAISLSKEATPTDIETAMNRIPKALRVATAEFCNSDDAAVSNLNHHECPQFHDIDPAVVYYKQQNNLAWFNL